MIYLAIVWFTWPLYDLPGMPLSCSLIFWYQIDTTLLVCYPSPSMFIDLVRAGGERVDKWKVYICLTIYPFAQPFPPDMIHHFSKEGVGLGWLKVCLDSAIVYIQVRGFNMLQFSETSWLKGTLWDSRGERGVLGWGMILPYTNVMHRNWWSLVGIIKFCIDNFLRAGM